VVPIIISGRNASGQTYREATETTAVSAHGAALKTRNPILIGMQLMVENLWDGIAEKAICVRAIEAEHGQDQHGIAIQLLHPRNIWGVNAVPYSPTPAILDLEQRSSELVESVLSLLRRRTAEILQEALKEFEDRMKALEAEAEERMAEHSGEALSGTELSLNQMRQEMLRQIKGQADQAVIFAEDSIRARVGELFLPHSKTSHDLPPGKKTGEDPTE
jgi:hypothetical protein